MTKCLTCQADMTVLKDATGVMVVICPNYPLTGEKKSHDIVIVHNLALSHPQLVRAMTTPVVLSRLPF